ncbi:unnamed protein product [Thelazia callipaeda]|uniref:T-complex protein 11-like protein 1 n=1 Tax=Thelazia callipaeda TaxID=103827 RepID=A0A0N5CVX7_THECL|nr:unnamed protein product [Thelazia callipaeda]
MSDRKEKVESETNSDSSKTNKWRDVVSLNKEESNLSNSSTKSQLDDSKISTSSDNKRAWEVACSGISLDEIHCLSEAILNMTFVHEIAVNPWFVIENPSRNSKTNAVNEDLKEKYWEKLREMFAEEPPDYSLAIPLFGEIKKRIINLLTPEQVRLISEVEGLLDVDLLKQQIENKCLDVRQLFESVLELLRRLCAPIRDEVVDGLRKLTDLIDMLRGVFDLLELMRVDMANFVVQCNRPALKEYSAEYERIQFMKLLEKDPELESSTMKWLQRHLNMESNDGSLSKKSFEDLSNGEVSDIINRAYMELLEWDPKDTYPGTFLIDRPRLVLLSMRYMQLILCTSCLFISCNLAGRDVAEMKNFYKNLKDELLHTTDQIAQKGMMKDLEAVSVFCNFKVYQVYMSLGKCWTREQSAVLKQQILQIVDEKNQIRKLVRDRVYDFILSSISFRRSFKDPMPSNLRMVHREVAAFTYWFARILNHNRETFGVYYGTLIKKLMDN